METLKRNRRVAPDSLPAVISGSPLLSIHAARFGPGLSVDRLADKALAAATAHELDNIERP
jgi:hypothetical protein